MVSLIAARCGQQGPTGQFASSPGTNRHKALQNLKSAQHHYIDKPEALARLTAQLGNGVHVALDTEADSLHRYTPKVCLIQLTASGVNYIVDPLAGLDLSGFLEKLADTSLIVHGGDYDLRMMLTSLGFQPRKDVFDTLVAAQLLGHTQFGLVALVEHYLDIQLTKHGQKSDWSRRPLSPEQLPMPGMTHASSRPSPPGSRVNSRVQDDYRGTRKVAWPWSGRRRSPSRPRTRMTSGASKG
jgi:hypothetical protein